MTVQRLNPASIGPEPPAYTHGMLVQGAARTLYIAGQVGMDPSGACPSDVAAQCRLAWTRIEAILGEAGMTLQDIVKTTIFLVNPADLAAFREVRNSVLKSHKPASTLVFVSQLVDPALKVEIEAVAVGAT